MTTEIAGSKIDGVRPFSEFAQFVISGWKDADINDSMTFGPDAVGAFWRVERIESGKQPVRTSFNSYMECPTVDLRIIRCDWANYVTVDDSSAKSLRKSRWWSRSA